MESKQTRLNRIQAATDCIIHHSQDASFNDLILPNLNTFKEFRLIYSTNNLDLNFNGINLSAIEDRCPAITKYFYGSGLLFYSDALQDELSQNGAAKFPLAYSLSFDTQVAEAIRCFEEGKNVSKWDWFENLVKTISELNLNFDYTFYLIEDLIRSYELNNQRPFNTVRALKRFDHLNCAVFLQNPKASNLFNETRESAGKRAIEALYTFQSSEYAQRCLLRRKALKLIMLKAMHLRWKSQSSFMRNFSELIEYSMQVIGKFAKLELYFGRKYLKSAESYAFFGAIEHPSLSALSSINGISWDLFSLRHQETMASGTGFGKFYIPFIASFDQRFKAMIKACPIRCLLLDDKNGTGNLMFLDELIFFKDFNEVTNANLRANLTSLDAKLERLSAGFNEAKIDDELLVLEDACKSMIKF